MKNPESAQENETHKLLWDFEIQMYHLISDRRPDRVIVNKKKKNLLNSGLNPDHRVKLKESEKINK